MAKKAILPTLYRHSLGPESPVLVTEYGFTEATAAPAYDVHYALELGVVLEGTFCRISGEASYDVGRGSPWFCGMWEPHGWQVRTAPCRVAVLMVWPPLLARLRLAEAPGIDWLQPFAADHTTPLDLAPETKRELLRLCDAQIAAAESSAPLSRARQHFILLEMLTYLLPAASTKSRQNAHSTSIAPALELALVERRPVRIGEAARACGLGRERFTLEFRKLMGISFAQFALRQRLGGAATDLAGSDEPVKAVARHWGFSDESHMHKLFVRHYRCTPKEYRVRSSSGR
jgi:AraC-like DNA-binding protein